MPLPPLVEPGTELLGEDRERYARHVLVPALGSVGQRRLLNARVCVVGAGGLGSPALLYLAGAGVGTIGIVDDDLVDLTNLQRQVIHDTPAVGTPKAASAAARVRALNPGITVVEHPERLTADNARVIFSGYDLVVDATDNFPTRYVVNDACAELGLPFVWAAIYRTDAQLSLFWKNPRTSTRQATADAATTPRDRAAGVDLRDLFPAPPDPTQVPSCADAGVLGPLCGQLGSMMAIEVVKLVCGVGEPLLGRVLFIDTLASTIAELPLRPRTPEHAIGSAAGDATAAAADGAGTASDEPTDTTGGAAPDTAGGAGSRSRVVTGTAGRATTGVSASIDVPTMTAAELARRLAEGHAITLIDVREPEETDLGMIAGARTIPLARFLAHVPEPAPGEDVVLYCKAGIRSSRAAAALLGAGRGRVWSLDGGILAWRDEIDPSLPRY